MLQMIKSAINAALAACRDEFAASVSSLIPVVIEWTKQNPDKTAADFPHTSFVGSNSVNIAPAGPALASAHAPLASHSSPSSVPGVLGGPSPLAELDALTVITRHTNISIIYAFFVAFWMSDAVDMFSQAERTPCTLLYMINGQTVDVGKATIINPTDRTIHTMQMPNTTLKVSVASVKPGHEDLAPPVPLGGQEDEPLKRLADCKGYFILWPKGLLRVESAAVMTTPTTTHPQEGMNTTTPPPQLLASPVMLGESGERREEGGPSRVDHDFSPCSSKQWMMS